MIEYCFLILLSCAFKELTLASAFEYARGTMWHAGSHCTAMKFPSKLHLGDSLVEFSIFGWAV